MSHCEGGGPSITPVNKEINFRTTIQVATSSHVLFRQRAGRRSSGPIFPGNHNSSVTGRLFSRPSLWKNQQKGQRASKINTACFAINCGACRNLNQERGSPKESPGGPAGRSVFRVGSPRLRSDNLVVSSSLFPSIVLNYGSLHG